MLPRAVQLSRSWEIEGRVEYDVKGDPYIRANGQTMEVSEWIGQKVKEGRQVRIILETE